MHIAPAREKFLKHFTGSLGIFIVEIHLREVRVKPFYLFALDPKILHQNAREILPVKGRPNIHLRVDKSHVLKLVDGVGDLAGPVFAAGLYHPIGKTMQRDIKNVASRTFEPGSQSPELVVVLQ